MYGNLMPLIIILGKQLDIWYLVVVPKSVLCKLVCEELNTPLQFFLTYCSIVLSILFYLIVLLYCNIE